jgi:hypothetical protein
MMFSVPDRIEPLAIFSTKPSFEDPRQYESDLARGQCDHSFLRLEAHLAEAIESVL